MPRFARAAWAALVCTVLTIVWGAYVRATGSGAGCGRHWPLCNGEIVPRSPQLKTLVELSHRVSAGIAVIIAIALAVWSFRVLGKGHAARKAAAAAAVFALGEAAIGAMLVLYELVAEDASMKRGVSGAMHLVNTFFLLGALTLTAHFAAGGSKLRLRGQGAVGFIAVAVLSGMILLGMSGAVTALGDTLFPPRTLAEGFSQDLSPTAHLFLRLRLFHPIIGGSVGAGVLALAATAPMARPSTRVPARVLAVAFLGQICLGFANVALLAPVWMQLLHLLVADVVWIALVLVAAELFADVPRNADVETSTSGEARAPGV